MLLSLTLLAALANGPTVTMAGRVVDAAGAPLAGAEVMLLGLPAPGGVPVVARGKADDSGHFALQRPAGLAGEGDWRAPRLWAYRDGYRLAFVTFPGPLPAAGEEVRVTLPTRGRAEYVVEGPDGRPVAGARVRVRSLAPFYTKPPEELAARLEARTDAVGRALIDAVSAEQVSEVGVEAEGLGLQPRYFDPTLPGPRRVVLRPAAALEGRFVAEDGRPIRGWKVSATTYTEPEPSGRRGPAGRAEPIPLAEDGSFRIPAIAVGALDLWVDWPDGPEPDILPSWPQRMTVHEGRDNRVEIPLRRAAEVTGVIRERGTGAPVPGVRVALFRPSESSGGDARTDAEGRYRFRSLPGKARAFLSEVPPTHIRTPAAFRDEFQVPTPPGRVELPPVELGRAAPPLKGEVRDPAGAPVAGATIGGQWNLLEDGAAIQAGIQAVSDAEGRFAIDRLAPDAKVLLSAQKGDLATAAPVEARGGQAAAVTLTIAPGRTVAIAGRVVDPIGKPLEGAAVRLNAQVLRNGQFTDWRQLTFESGPV
jgi:protocatechuate 3,4-dioxygenase beta subunit